MIRLLLALAIFLAAPTTQADDNVSNPGYWGVITGTGNFADLSPKAEKWRWWLEGQLRFVGDDPDFSQAFIRPAIGYTVAEGTSVWLGYGWFRSSPPAGTDFDEHRIFQQLSWGRTWDPIRMATRTRIEQRFIERNSGDTAHRFRQRVDFFWPPRSRVYLNVNDEAFFHLNDTTRTQAGFDQNRLFAGPGWAIDENRHVRIEAGYLNQFINRPGPVDTMNHIAVVLLQFRR